MLGLYSLLLVAMLYGCPAFAELPKALDPRLKLELVAAEPDIVTPTGIAVDERGRIWVIENHTHQRPDKYNGPATDRIRVLDDFGPDGRARRVTTFADGFRNAMGIILGKQGEVYVVTRSEIHRLRDASGAGQATERKVLVRLETLADYPHNGLSGFAFDALGELYFGLGENFGAVYKLVGTDRLSLTGGGEGGSVYRCRPDGTRLERIATGFWNPFHVAFDAYGRLFVVDNDPDSRGPCRLIHIVPGGDYGYRFRFGRKGIHPFQSWNGELPGTLPMVAGTAEAPSGILHYEGSGLPAEYRGKLLVTSWGDHVVEQFTLQPRGASFSAEARTILQGGEDFRPVGITTAPDDSVVLSDWVDKSYPVHGKGRIWRLRSRAARDSGAPNTETRALDTSRAVRLQKFAALARQESGPMTLRQTLTGGSDPVERLHTLWACATLADGVRKEFLTTAIQDADADVRGEAAALVGRLLAPSAVQEFEQRLIELARSDPSPRVRMNALMQVRSPERLVGFIALLADPDPFLVHAALTVLGRSEMTSRLLDRLHTADAPLRLGILLALRRAGDDSARAALPSFLVDDDPGVRRAAIQWVGEERLAKYTSGLSAAAARPPVQRVVFEALLASQDLLGEKVGPRDPNKESSGDAFVAKVYRDASQPAAFRTLALRMLRPDHPALVSGDLVKLLNHADSDFRFEALRTLAQRTDPVAQQALRRLAVDKAAPLGFRAEAVLGLAHAAPASAETRQLLHDLSLQPELRRDALRSLREALEQKEAQALRAALATAAGPSAAAQETTDQLALLGPTKAIVQPTAELKELLLRGHGNAEAGERVFFHPRGPRCAACHRVDGRGEAIGPDLSRIGAARSRDKLIESILEPSKEIMPAYTTWVIATRDGKTRTGTIVDVGPDSTFTIADALGKREVLRRLDVEEKQVSPTSIMPVDLHQRLTRQEFLDLLAYLAERK